MSGQDFSRRSFLSKGAAGAGAVALAGAATEASAQAINWDQTADVVIIGAGVAGLPAAITARELGASVIVVEENYDIGGRGMLSGGRVQLGGGHALQQKFNIKDNADQVFLDWVRADDAESRYSDRELVRVYADENVSTYQFLLDNGVEFIEKPIGPVDASTLPRIFVTKEWHIPAEVVAPHRNRNGSGLVRRLAESARKKGAQILLKHKMTRIVREKPTAGKRARHRGEGGRQDHQHPRHQRRHRRDRRPHRQRRLPPHVRSAADRGIPAGLPALRRSERRAARSPRWTSARRCGRPRSRPPRAAPPSPRRATSAAAGATPRWCTRPTASMFPQAKATGLTVKDWQDLIMVNQFGKRFWDEGDGSYKFFNAAMAYNGDKTKLNGGGPIWAIFDADGAAREKWNTKPPNVDPDGWFYQADTLAELAGRIKNQYQKQPMPGAALTETVARYNSFVAEGVDKDFKKKTPMHKIEKPPFYAAWATPILHDTLTGLRTNTSTEVIDMRGEVIPNLYCAGESQGGFAQHGLARCLVFGRIAGRTAAKNSA